MSNMNNDVCNIRGQIVEAVVSRSKLLIVDTTRVAELYRFNVILILFKILFC